MGRDQKGRDRLGASGEERGSEGGRAGRDSAPKGGPGLVDASTMGLTLPYVLSSEVCVFFLIVVPPLVLYVCAFHVWTHLRSYKNPVVQRYCIRISLIVPVYLLDALLSFAIPTAWLWTLDLVKAGYEAFALYSFLCLMLSFAGGPASLCDLWESEDRYLTGSWITGTCMHGTIKLDGLFLKRLVQGVIQFVIVRLCLVFCVPILIAKDLYIEGKARPDRAWIYVMLIHNVSLWVCLYSLWLFFLSTRHYLRHFSPALKFGLIKSIIFISFWQKIVLEVLIASNVVETPPTYTSRDIMDGWNSFLVIVECLPLSILNFIAFNSKTGEYDAEWGAWRLLKEHGNAKHATRGAPGGKDMFGNGGKDEDQAPRPAAALAHAMTATDVFQHILTTFSNHYGRRRYLSLELSQRESATPLPVSKSRENSFL